MRSLTFAAAAAFIERQIEKLDLVRAMQGCDWRNAAVAIINCALLQLCREI
jgi:hypothetical protein